MTLHELRKYLAEMLDRANRPQSSEGTVEIIAGQMWREFIPYGISLYTLEGALQQIVSTFPEPAEEEDEE